MIKKGALNLSINAIVILILAITMLGLGLGFMKTMFGKTTGQLEDIAGDIQDQMIEDLRQSNEKLTFNQNDLELKRSAKEVIYFGIKNDIDTSGEAERTFGIQFGCSDGIGGASGEVIEFENFPDADIAGNEVYVGKVIISAPSSAEITTYRCNAEITDLKEKIVHAKKQFYITVK